MHTSCNYGQRGAGGRWKKGPPTIAIGWLLSSSGWTDGCILLVIRSHIASRLLVVAGSLANYQLVVVDVVDDDLLLQAQCMTISQPPLKCYFLLTLCSIHVVLHNNAHVVVSASNSEIKDFLL